MILNLERVKAVDIPLNASRYPNNAHLAYNQSAIYNDSVNLYKAIKLVIEDLVNLTPSITDLNAIHNSNSVTIESSDGLDTIINSVTDTMAGVMTPPDKIILDDLAVLVGITGGNLGTFTGATISDNTTIKNALQQLETAIEAGSVGNTDLFTTYGTDSLTIVSSTGSDAPVSAAGPLSAGVMSVDQYTLLTSITDLQTLTGVAQFTSDLGTFAGTIITDNANIKQALEELEAAVISVASGGGIYGGSGTIFADAVATTSGGGFTINNNGTDNIYIGDITGAAHGLNFKVTPFSITIGDVYGAGDEIIQVNSYQSQIRFQNNIYAINANTHSVVVENDYIITGFNNFNGFQYAADYSADYTLRSLVDKEYVDGLTGTTTNLSSTLSDTQIEIFSSSGTSTIIPSATDSLAGLMSAQDKNDFDDLIGLTGMPAGADHLGTFTGTTIPDSQSIKSALQSLETAVEAASLSAGGYLLVTTNYTLEPINNTVYARATANNINITCGASMKEGEVYYLYMRMDNTYGVNLMLGAGHQFFRTSTAPGVEFWTGTWSYLGDDRNYLVMLQRRGTIVFLTTLTDF